MCPVWLLVAVVVVSGTRGAVSQCWEHPSCQELNSESNMMECIQLCRSDLTAETPVIPGNAHLQPPPPADPSSTSPLAKRSYSMEHFRWGKPVGRKRRPVKVYTSNGLEEESAEVFPGEMRRRELANELLAAAAAEEEEEKVQEMMQEAEEEQHQQLLGGLQEKKDGPYKMKHFRWSGPPASKRYGGFMKSWDERSQRPLLTLFKNVINKDGQQQK
ncbi:pro-opiomelanocortin-like [Anabas testudineus]|uniref:pro-opiomelanocortin-like n=1 Tax=Anabas testudineus TaxID=64144 RepID=UPI000E45591D|nr:pro-opiomelanocortin-like [Anabas testudineus]